MTDYWNYLGKGIQTFMGSNKDAIKFESENIFGVINDGKTYSYNAVMINTKNATAQEILMSKYSDIPIFAYVSKESINAFNLWNKDFYLKPRGKTTVLRKIGELKLPPSNSKIDLNIILAETQSHLKDIIDLENKGKINSKNTSKVFGKEFLENQDTKTFIAYHQDVPIAKISVVIDEKIATLWGMKTDPDYEKLGAMVLLGEYLINYNIKNFGVKEHYAVPFAIPVFQSSINRGAQAIEEVFLFGSEVNN
jgi:hypothetical protein